MSRVLSGKELEPYKCYSSTKTLFEFVYLGPGTSWHKLMVLRHMREASYPTGYTSDDWCLSGSYPEYEEIERPNAIRIVGLFDL